MAGKKRCSRKIKSPAELAKLWDDYKCICDTNTKTEMVETTFTNADGTSTSSVSKEILSPKSYTKEGLLDYIGISRQSFSNTYEKDHDYADIVDTISLECELDVRAKFESGQIPTNLAALWMSKFGYSTKTEAKTEAHITDDTVTNMDDYFAALKAADNGTDKD